MRWPRARSRRACASSRRRAVEPSPRIGQPLRPGRVAVRTEAHRVELLKQALDIFLHLDQHLNAWADAFGPWLYVILFLVVFCETGLVVTPFLPGDSLLFAV